jgi:hypothetical protein
MSHVAFRWVCVWKSCLEKILASARYFGHTQ